MKSEAKKRLINFRWTIFGAMSISLICSGFFLISSAARAALVTKTWDGGGATNNWSEAANWSSDTVPGAGEAVTFDATGTKNVTIDVNINVASIFIAAGYTGTITQSNTASVQINGSIGCGGPCFRQDGGTFNGSSNTITINTSGFGAVTMNGGAFNGGSGDILLAGPTDQNPGLSMQGGSFKSTSGTLTTAGSINTQGTSSFLHNNGTVTLTASGPFQGIVGDSNHLSITFNNLNFNLADGASFLIGSRPVVLGNLALNDGILGANGSTIEARGGVSISPNFDDGIATLELANGSGPRTITLTTNLHLPRFVVNDPNVIVNTSGSGTLTFPHRLTLSAGVINQGSVDLIISALGGGDVCYTQNGGTFNGSSNPITVNAAGFGAIRMNGGTFNGGSGDILLAGPSDQNPGLSMQGGSFKSTSGTLTTAGPINTQGTSSFLHNNGTVTLTASGPFQGIVGDSNHLSITFNNLNFNLADGASFLIGSRPIVLGHLALNDGSISGSTIEVRGTYTLAPTFDGGNVAIEFGPGGSPRTLTLTAGLTYPNIVLNDPNLTVNTSGSGTLVLPHQLIIRQGIFNQGNVDLTITQSGTQNIGSGSCLEMSGGTFNGSSHLLTLTANGFGSVLMTGGTFNGGSGDITATGPGGNVQVNGGSFKSTSGTLFAGKSLRIQNNSGFDPNGGTVVFGEGADGGFTFIAILADDPQGALVDLAFNNVVINKTPGTTVLLGLDHMFVNGTLTLNDGQIDAAGSANINAFANVNIGPGFDGFTNRVKLNFSGFACQTVTISTTQNFANDWIVNKSSCGLTAVGNFGVHSIFIPNGSLILASDDHVRLTGDLNVGIGNLNAGNGAVVNASGDLIIGIGGDVTVGSAAVVSAGNGQIGGSVDLSGSDGSLIINAGANITSSGSIDISGLNDTVNLNSLTVEPGGKFTADHAETITLGGDVVNNGLINLYASGSECTGFAFLVLQSSVPATTRNWSGNGVFRMVHVNVVDQAGSAAIRVHDGVANGATGANWIFDNNCRASALHAPFDFDGDGKSDQSVFRPSERNWYVLKSSGEFFVKNWGLATDILTPGDYDGDGLADTAVFRPADGNWYVIRSSDSTVDAVNWGTSGDVPVAGDYDGDGKADKAVFRPADGNWYIIGTTSGVQVVNWGIASDVTVPGDYDGDGKTDLAVFRPSNGNWFIIGTTSGIQIVNWGIASDVTVPGDYDGDGKTDVAVFRPTNGNWFIIGTTSGVQIVNWGIAGDVTVPGDYDGDGKSDLAVFRPSNGNWFIIGTTSGTQIINWGIASDITIPARHIP